MLEPITLLLALAVAYAAGLLTAKVWRDFDQASLVDQPDFYFLDNKAVYLLSAARYHELAIAEERCRRLDAKRRSFE